MNIELLRPSDEVVIAASGALREKVLSQSGEAAHFPTWAGRLIVLCMMMGNGQVSVG